MADQRKYAVVTGGSNGIGLELARQFASNGYDVLIAAEDEGHLAKAKQDLAATGATIKIHAADLATEQGVRSLCDALAGRKIDAIAINAGVGLGGKFIETDLDRELKMVDLNCRGAVQLAKHVAKDMVARKDGKILFTSSIAGTMPDPFEAVYGATKVFLRWFGEALREELKADGVTVTVLMPSTTETNFFKRADMMDTAAGTMKKDDPAVVAKAGLEALIAGKDRIVPTVKNKLMAGIADTLDDVWGAKVHRGLSEPGTAKHSSGGSSSVMPLVAGVAALGAGVALFAHWRGAQQDDASPKTDASVAVN